MGSNMNDKIIPLFMEKNQDRINNDCQLNSLNYPDGLVTHHRSRFLTENAAVLHSDSSEMAMAKFPKMEQKRENILVNKRTPAARSKRLPEKRIYEEISENLAGHIEDCKESSHTKRPTIIRRKHRLGTTTNSSDVTSSKNSPSEAQWNCLLRLANSGKIRKRHRITEDNVQGMYFNFGPIDMTSNGKTSSTRNKFNVGSCNNGSHGTIFPSSLNYNLCGETKIYRNDFANMTYATETKSNNVTSIKRDNANSAISAYEPYCASIPNDSDQSIRLKHKIYNSELHGTASNPILSSKLVSPEAQDILLILRETISKIIDAIISVEEKISEMDFSACTSIVDHLVKIPNILNSFIDNLHYTPEEYELVFAAKSITHLINEVSSDSVEILSKIVELGHDLYYLGRILGEKFIPDELPRVIYSIEVRLQRLKIGRVARQYFHIPISYDFIVTPYSKDRRLTRLEEDFRCQVKLLHPHDPRCQYCPHGYRTIEVIYGEESGGIFEAFEHRLNRIMKNGRYTTRLVTTVLRQFNGQESIIPAEHAAYLLNFDRRPRYEDIRAQIMSDARPKIVSLSQTSD